MDTFKKILLLLLTVNGINCDVINNNRNNLLNGIINLFTNMSVHTVWATTCWSTNANNELLTRLSNEDISIAFDLNKISTVRGGHGTWYKSGMLVDLSCDQAARILQQASDERLFNTQNEWVLFNRHGNPNGADTSEIALTTFRSYMNESYALPDSRVYLLIDTGSGPWEVWDGFRLSVFEDIRVSRVGTVTADRVEFGQSDRTDFRRVVLKASAVISDSSTFGGWDNPPFMHSLDTFAYMNYAVTSVLAEQLNFTMNLTVSSDYGWVLKNGTYSGVIGELQKKEIDFTASGALMRHDRMDVCDPTVGTFMVRNFAIFRQPPLAIMKNIFTLPFALSVWITTFAMLFVFAVVLIFLAWTSNRLKGKKTDYSTAFDTVTVVLGAVCQQGLSITVRSIPARLATFTLFLFAVFLFTSYAATIVILLESNSHTIMSLKDLAEKPITFSVEDIKHNYIYFNETVDPHIKKIYLEKIKPQGEKGFTSPETGLERVRNQFHSFVVEVASAHHIVAKTWQEHEKCNLIEMEFYKMPTITIYVIKNSGYKDVFKQKIIQQQEIGLKHRTIHHMIPQKPKCNSGDLDLIHFDSVSLEEIYPALSFLGWGICVSTLIFLYERVSRIRFAKRKIAQN